MITAPRCRGFTLLELAVVVMMVVAALIAILLVVMQRVPRGAQNSTQLRGIHQGMVIFAQSNKLQTPGAIGYYPGLNPDGTLGQITVEERFKLLLDANAFMPEYIIHPQDQIKTEWQSGPLTSANYSYAMLQVPAQGGRHGEWAETINPDAIVLSDRNTGTAQQPASIWTNAHGPWKGTVVRNDNSTSFETTDTFDLTYAGVTTKDDKLFEAAGDDDAYLIESGN